MRPYSYFSISFYASNEINPIFGFNLITLELIFPRHVFRFIVVSDAYKLTFSCPCFYFLLRRYHKFSSASGSYQSYPHRKI